MFLVQRNTEFWRCNIEECVCGFEPSIVLQITIHGFWRGVPCGNMCGLTATFVPFGTLIWCKKGSLVHIGAGYEEVFILNMNPKWTRLLGFAGVSAEGAYASTCVLAFIALRQVLLVLHTSFTWWKNSISNTKKYTDMAKRWSEPVAWQQRSLEIRFALFPGGEGSPRIDETFYSRMAIT